MNQPPRSLKKRLLRGLRKVRSYAVLPYYWMVQGCRDLLGLIGLPFARPKSSSHRGQHSPKSRWGRRLQKAASLIWLPFYWLVQTGSDVLGLLGLRTSRRQSILKPLVLGLPAVGCLAAAAWLVAAVLLQDREALEDAYASRARQALAAEDFETARLCYARLAETDSARPDHVLGLAKCWRALGNVERSDQLLARLAPVDRPGFAPAHLYLASKLMETASPTPEVLSRAQLHLTYVVQAQPGHIEARLLLGKLYLSTGQIDRAVEQLEPIAVQYPELTLVLARLHADRGQDEPRKRWAKQALDYFGPKSQAKVEDHAARLQVAECKMLLTDYAGAVALLETGWTLFRRPEFKRAQAEVYAFWLDDAARGATLPLATKFEVVEKGLQSNPSNLRLLKGLVDLQAADPADDGRTRKLMQGLLADGRASAGLHLCLGIDAWQAGRASEAQYHLSRALDLAPHMALVANNLAWVMLKEPASDLPKALALANLAVEREPKDARFLDTRGQILLKLGKYQEAVKDLELALPAMPNDAALHAALAEAYDHLGLAELAGQHRRRADFLAVKGGAKK